jgi:hypothetical protein
MPWGRLFILQRAARFASGGPTGEFAYYEGFREEAGSLEYR